MEVISPRFMFQPASVYNSVSTRDGSRELAGYVYVTLLAVTLSREVSTVEIRFASSQPNVVAASGLPSGSNSLIWAGTCPFSGSREITVREPSKRTTRVAKGELPSTGAVTQPPSVP